MTRAPPPRLNQSRAIQNSKKLAGKAEPGARAWTDVHQLRTCVLFSLSRLSGRHVRLFVRVRGLRIMLERRDWLWLNVVGFINP
jgi:hypothetical protein